MWEEEVWKSDVMQEVGPYERMVIEEEVSQWRWEKDDRGIREKESKEKWIEMGKGWHDKTWGIVIREKPGNEQQCCNKPVD